MKPQLFALALAAAKERLVMIFILPMRRDMQDPLLALLEDYNKGDLDKQVPLFAKRAAAQYKAGRDRPIVIADP